MNNFPITLKKTQDKLCKSNRQYFIHMRAFIQRGRFRFSGSINKKINYDKRSASSVKGHEDIGLSAPVKQ